MKAGLDSVSNLLWAEVIAALILFFNLKKIRSNADSKTGYSLFLIEFEK